jgi:hypothetical protein
MQGRTGMKDNGKKMEEERGNMNKKFWEEQIAYFPLIRHGPHRNRRLQQFFVAGGTSLPEPLPSNGPTQTHLSNSSSIVACIRCSGNVFTEPLPSNGRKGYTCRHTD